MPSGFRSMLPRITPETARTTRGRSLDHHDERLPFFHDIRGELRPGAAADVLRRVDRSGRDEQDVAGLERHRRLALDLILQRAFEDIEVPGCCARATNSAKPLATISTATAVIRVVFVFMWTSFRLQVCVSESIHKDGGAGDQRASRSDLNAARSSAAKSSGCSHAAK